jgi:DNA-binding CsgD family transcriptional regulator
MTSRQFECLVLVAQGKTDREAADVLGISQQTVHKHIEAAKKRFRVHTRIQLVVRALWENRLDLVQIVT